jgi:hypothetical protein
MKGKKNLTLVLAYLPQRPSVSLLRQIWLLTKYERGKNQFNVSTCIFTSTTIRKPIAPNLAIDKI